MSWFEPSILFLIFYVIKIKRFEKGWSQLPKYVDPCQEAVSIVIAVRNEAQNIGHLLEDLQVQSHTNFEIIIVNDGSNEKLTLEILKKLKKNKKIKIINKKNSGLSAARNSGIDVSKSKYILMLDSDDWLRLDALEIFYKYLEKNKKVSYVYSNIHLADEKKGVLKKNFNFFEQLFTNQIPYCILFRRNIFERSFKYDEKMKKGFEDWDLNIRLGAKGFYGKCINKNLFKQSKYKSGSEILK